MNKLWVEASQPETGPGEYLQKLRQDLLGKFLLLILGLNLVMIVINVIELAFTFSDELVTYLVQDFISLFFFTGLFFINRRGQTRLAAYVTVVSAIAGASILIVPETPTTALVALALLVFISGFIFQPHSAFVVAALSAAGYSIAFFFSQSIWEYDTITVLILFAVATISRATALSLNVSIREAQQFAIEYRDLFERVPIGLYRTTADGKILEANPALAAMFGYADRDEFLQASVRDLYAESSDWDAAMSRVDRNGYGEDLYAHFRRKDGSLFWAEDQTKAVYDISGRVKWYEGSLIDVTKKKEADDALRESKARLELFFAQSLNGFFFMELAEPICWNDEADKEALVEYALTAERVAKVNQAILDQYGVPEEVALGLSPSDIFAHDLPLARQTWRTLFEDGHVHIELEERKADGSPMWTEGDFICLYDDEGRITGHFGIQREITHRRQAATRINDQLARLSALRAIDVTISGSTNLPLILRTILDQVMARLKVDAALILLLDPYLNVLTFSTGAGFKQKDIQQTRIDINEDDYAARIVRERRTLSTHRLDDDHEHHRRIATLIEEGFTCYYGVPLIVKGQIKGVIEVFRRACEGHDWEWVEFLQVLANQAAIAIDNISLFENLQRSNFELSRAYETTIDGWSRALDLRDKETEGHSLRVTELTLRIARAMNIPERDLLAIRRGSMLHDIGKMGVPDHILLKAGALTEDEWALMRKHPQFAFELLSPIEYLRTALDIPHYHHEKWDGSGYPNGLNGEEIPLAARIFAIVDVYDALTSERPYRPAWPKDRALRHIRDLAGSHFDPAIVEVFLEVMKEK
ncbi:MAG: HD domain-containing phosphohydrolase [Chloroflexota bacterium]